MKTNESIVAHCYCKHPLKFRCIKNISPIYESAGFLQTSNAQYMIHIFGNDFPAYYKSRNNFVHFSDCIFT